MSLKSYLKISALLVFFLQILLVLPHDLFANESPPSSRSGKLAKVISFCENSLVSERRQIQKLQAALETEDFYKNFVESSQYLSAVLEIALYGKSSSAKHEAQELIKLIVSNAPEHSEFHGAVFKRDFKLQFQAKMSSFINDVIFETILKKPELVEKHQWSSFLSEFALIAAEHVGYNPGLREKMVDIEYAYWLKTGKNLGLFSVDHSEQDLVVASFKLRKLYQNLDKLRLFLDELRPTVEDFDWDSLRTFAHMDWNENKSWEMLRPAIESKFRRIDEFYPEIRDRFLEILIEISTKQIEKDPNRPAARNFSRLLSTDLPSRVHVDSKSSWLIQKLRFAVLKSLAISTPDLSKFIEEVYKSPFFDLVVKKKALQKAKELNLKFLNLKPL